MMPAASVLALAVFVPLNVLAPRGAHAHRDVLEGATDADRNFPNVLKAFSAGPAASAPPEKHAEAHAKHLSTGGKRILGGYGMRTVKDLARWWRQSIPWGDGPLVNKAVFVVFWTVLLLGPFVVYLFYSWLIWATTGGEAHAQWPMTEKVVQAVALPVKLISVLACTHAAIGILIAGAHGTYPALHDLERALYCCLLLCFGLALLRALGKVDESLQQLATARVTNQAFLKRRDFINSLAHGTHIVGPTATNDELGHYMYHYVWRPFYAATTCVTCFFIVIEVLGWSKEGCLFLFAYICLTSLLAVFSAQTLGQELYGGLVLFLERPFVEGDIISLDKMGSQGGAQTDVMGSMVTGFVERIGVRSTIVRRFDMRAVWVPNSMFVRFTVANWNTRPRKLIYLEFAISHRTPVELCKAFQEKVQYLIKNHSGVDQQMYTKAVFRKLDTGMDFLIVCFNARGTKKQQVQQDIVFRLVDLARALGVRLTFDQKSCFVEREDVPVGEVYLGEQTPTPAQVRLREAGEAGLDLGDLLPKKKAQPTAELRFAPDGNLVVRVERVVLLRASSGQQAVPQAPEADGPVEGMQERRKEPISDLLLTEGTAYRVRLRTAAAEGAAGPAEPSAPEVWTRAAFPAAGGGAGAKDSAEMLLYENLAVPLAGGKSSKAHLPQILELQLFHVEKGLTPWVYYQPKALLGTATCDFKGLVLQSRSAQAHTLELLGAGKGLAGHVHVQAYVPESLAEAIEQSGGSGGGS